MMDARRNHEDLVELQNVYQEKKVYQKREKNCAVGRIRGREMELLVLLREEQINKEAKANAKTKTKTKKGKKTKIQDQDDDIFTRVNKLPEEMIRIIGEYLPCTLLHIQLLESCVKTSVLIRKMSAPMSVMFLRKIGKMPGLLKLVSPSYEHAKRQIRYLPDESGTLTRNLDYQESIINEFSANQNKQHIKFIFYTAREANPEFAYQILRLMHILIKPNKKYNINQSHALLPPHVFTIQDLQEAFP